MEFRHRTAGGGEYYSIAGYELRGGLRAAIGGKRIISDANLHLPCPTGVTSVDDMRTYRQ
jgi:hypothetical protein